MKRLGLPLIGLTAVVTLLLVNAAFAAPPPFSLVPFEFVGAAGDCGPTAGTDTVTAKWDNSTGNPLPSILLQKLGPTSNCAAAGVDIITPLEGSSVSAVTELNFDYKTGGHCGAGAPRFNLALDGAGTAFLGCSGSGGVHTDLGNGWTHVEFNSAAITAAVVLAGGTPASVLDDLYIIFDEGSDTPSGGTIGTAGTVYIDNISLNGDVVGSPTGPLSQNDCKKGGWVNLTDDEGHSFRNQGDCVSFVSTGGRNKAHQ